MSTVSKSTVSKSSTTKRKTPTSAATRFWKEPATGWDVTKFVIAIILIPLLGAILGGAGWLIRMNFDVQSQAKDNDATRAIIQKWQEAKEDRGARLVTLEHTVGDLRDEVKEMRGDIKLLLRAVGTVEGREK